MKTNLSQFEHRIPKLIGEDTLFKAAVCISLIETKEDYDILFEVRAAHIPDQPGDVCLPGGAVDAGETYEAACIRETCEELLIRPEQIRIIGPADINHAVNSIIYPYVGILSDYHDTFNADEVAEVFRVPLRFFRETPPETYASEVKVTPKEGFPYDRIYGGRSYRFLNTEIENLFWQYEGHTIWGLTARMIHSFLKLL